MSDPFSAGFDYASATGFWRAFIVELENIDLVLTCTDVNGAISPMVEVLLQRAP